MLLEYGKVNQYKDFLTEEEHKELMYNFRGPSWDIGAGELGLRNQGVPVRSFLYKELINNTYIRNLITSKIENLIGSKVEIVRMYGNAQAHSQCGFIHNDDSTDATHGSLVYYPDVNWMPLHGGHLIFVDETEREVLHSIFPTGNSAVLFNSKMLHAALDPSPWCLDHRTSIATKFKVLG